MKKEMGSLRDDNSAGVKEEKRRLKKKLRSLRRKKDILLSLSS